jgi:hypothetical protein
MRRLTIAVFLLSAFLLRAEDWGPLRFLIGDWVGVGGGQPGQASAGAFSLMPDLQGTILLRKNFAEYPAAGGRAAVRHDDLTVIYRDTASKQLRATYWDNEGHVIPYSIQPAADGVVFLSDGPRDATRYRLTYAGGGKDQVKIKFEVAEPGKDFVVYVEASARRKP